MINIQWFPVIGDVRFRRLTSGEDGSLLGFTTGYMPIIASYPRMTCL